MLDLSELVKIGLDDGLWVKASKVDGIKVGINAGDGKPLNNEMWHVEVQYRGIDNEELLYVLGPFQDRRKTINLGQMVADEVNMGLMHGASYHPPKAIDHRPVVNKIAEAFGIKIPDKPKDDGAAGVVAQC